MFIVYVLITALVGVTGFLIGYTFGQESREE